MSKLFEHKNYDFIKTNPDLSQVIYLVLGGSRAYGTDTPDSDIDLRGVLIEPKQYLLGLKSFEQFEDLPSDTVIYGLKKFASLLSKANPNTIELLGVDEECIVAMTKQGELLSGVYTRLMHAFSADVSALFPPSIFGLPTGNTKNR